MLVQAFLAMKTLEEVRMVLVLHIDIMWKKRMLSL